MYAKGLQLITVSAERFVLKRGIHELVLSGKAAGDIVGSLVELLDGTRSREQILAAFSGDLRPDVEQVLDALVRRGMCSTEPEPAPQATGSELQATFYRNFGAVARRTPEHLARATVLVIGVNYIARALVRGLRECGVGKVIVADHPGLSNRLAPADWLVDGARDAIPSDHELADVSMICATSDLGEGEALLAVNRLALRVGKRFLPAWIDEMAGTVGPLTYPQETACLRCYRLRADANDTKYEVRRAIRKHITGDPEASPAIGLLPPMAGVLGEIAAMEVIKCLGEFVPVDVVGRIVEVNLVSFSSGVRRVLKVPRCPDCSEQTRRAPSVLTRGPQIAKDD